MQVEPTLDGIDLCFQNSLRLFEDACTEGLSLPTVGALLEIGLEEVAKGFLILICLEKKERTLPEISIDVDKSLFELKDRIGNFIYNINCQKQLPSAFKYHKIKTEILNFLGIIASFALPESTTMKKLTKNYLKSYVPNLKEDVLENQFNSPAIIDSINKKMNTMGSVLKEVSGGTKESGFYVDWTGSGFKYPEINKSTIQEMAHFLFASITGFKYFTKLIQIQLQTKFDFLYIYQKLTVLKSRVK